MATLTKTISNTLRLYGVEPHNKWGTLVWGTSTWAQQDIQWTDYKSVVNTMVVSSTRGFRVEHLVSDDIVLDTVISRQFPAWISSGFSVSSRIASVYRLNSGWYSVKGDTANALSFPVDSFSEVVDPSFTWSTVTRPTTTWTQL